MVEPISISWYVGKGIFKLYKANGGAKGMAGIGLKHCTHCDGRLGPCPCPSGCPIPSNNLRNCKCFPIQKGFGCDSCGITDFQGARYRCQTCPDYDLCGVCYGGGCHDVSHPFFMFAGHGRPCELLKPRVNKPTKQGSFNTSSTSSGSSYSAGMASSAHSTPADAAVRSKSYRSSAPPRGDPMYSSGTTMSNVVHCDALCDGPACLREGQFIVGPCYMCAECPPSVDLCEECYLSEKAHNISHPFKRFDQANSPVFVMCPPQLDQEQSQDFQE